MATPKQYASALALPPLFSPIAGMVERGNLDPLDPVARAAVHNPDGSYSTTRSISVSTPKGETIIPSVANGQNLRSFILQQPYQPAIDQYRKTGGNFGTFQTPAQADAYAQALHEWQAAHYDAQGNRLR